MIDPEYPITQALNKQSELTQRLLDELQGNAQLETGVAATTAAAGGGGDAHVTYELYYAPEQERFQRLAKLSELERRVGRSCVSKRQKKKYFFDWRANQFVVLATTQRILSGWWATRSVRSTKTSRRW